MGAHVDVQHWAVAIGCQCAHGAAETTQLRWVAVEGAAAWTGLCTWAGLFLHLR